jgi:hypothetical protein
LQDKWLKDLLKDERLKDLLRDERLKVLKDKQLKNVEG